MQAHEVDYEIFGDDIQTVEVELDPEETVIAEAGAMNWMDDGITFEAKKGDGSNPASGFFGKILEASRRAISGDSIITHFTNSGEGKKRVAFSAPYPGKIMAIDMAEIGGEILCQKDNFLAAAFGTRIEIAMMRQLGAGFFGGQGFILQRFTGDGQLFVHTGGTLVEKHLEDDVLRIDTGCLVAFSSSLEYSIAKADMQSSFLGEGLYLATLQGTGTVYLQSLPFARLADRIIRSGASQGKNG